MNEKQGQSPLLAAALLCGAGTLLTLTLAVRFHVAVAQAIVPYLVIGFLLAAAVLLRLRLRQRADEERQSLAADSASAASGRLFDPLSDTEAMSAARTQSQFERWAVPAMAPVLAILQIAWAARRLQAPVTDPPGPEAPLLLVAALLAGQSFALFLLGRYQIGLARQAHLRWLRGPGVHLHLAALVGLLAAAAAAGAHAGLPALPGLAARALDGLLLVLGGESLLRGIAEFYRPQRRRSDCLSYESRLAHLLAEPAPWLRNVTQTLDYQFGFQVSETWYFRFFRGALLPLLLFQALGLYLLSCLVFIGPDEEGILERNGRPRPDHWRLESGPHLKAPWPFETVRRVPAKRLQVVAIGSPDAETSPHRLWTDAHHGSQEPLLTAHAGELSGGDAVPVNLMNLHASVEFLVSDVYAYAYRAADPAGALERIVRRAVTREMASHDLRELLAAERSEAALRLREQVQAEADAWGLGIAIQTLQVQGIHPPVQVALAFESVLAAQEEQRAGISRATAHANRQVPLALARSAAAHSEAEAYATRRRALAEADARRFQTLLATDHDAPSIFRQHTYLRVLRDSLAGARKYVVAADASDEVLQFNLEEKARLDLFDFTSPALKGSAP